MKNDVSIRSCWECNPAHKHMKNMSGILWCFVCGNIYKDGVKIDESLNAINKPPEVMNEVK